MRNSSNGNAFTHLASAMAWQPLWDQWVRAHGLNAHVDAYRSSPLPVGSWVAPVAPAPQTPGVWSRPVAVTPLPMRGYSLTAHGRSGTRLASHENRAVSRDADLTYTVEQWRAMSRTEKKQVRSRRRAATHRNLNSNRELRS